VGVPRNKYMSTLTIVRFLEFLQEKDKQFQADICRDSYATFCSECKKNTAIGLYPPWHRFGRDLCSKCGAEYTHLLKNLNAYGECC